MNNPARDRLTSGEAWDDFCETLKTAGRIVNQFNDEPSDQEKAEWYRYLSRMVRNGFERMVENCEPERPRLRDAPWRQSINVQSPDQDHLMCEFVNGDHEYRITGNRGTLPYFVMATWTAPQPTDLASRNWAEQGTDGLVEFDPTRLTTTSFLKSEDIDFDNEGNFEVVLGRTAQERNWLRLDPSSTGVLVRTLYQDRKSATPASMRIERTDHPRPKPIAPEEMSANLAKAGQVVLGYAELVRDWWENNLSHRPNEIQFSESTYLSNGGVLDRLHGFGAWQKKSSEALVIRFTPPDCEHWTFQICNRWQENLDIYEDRQGYITKFKSVLEPDGSILAILSDRDPRAGGNWIDSFEHETGVFSLRLIQTFGGPQITISRVQLVELENKGLDALHGVDPILSGQLTD